MTTSTESMNKSQIIRSAVSDGMSTGEAAKLAGVSYQFAYNVLHRIPGTSERREGNVASEIRIELQKEGATVSSVAKKLNKSYQQVYQVGRKVGLVEKRDKTTGFDFEYWKDSDDSDSDSE